MSASVPLSRKFLAELIGTFWLVLGGCGSAVLAALTAGGVIWPIASGREGFALTGSNPLATNGWGAHSPGGYGFGSALLIELVLSFAFLLIILGTTHRLAPLGFAGVPIGLSLTLIHLISIPVTNTSVNPARSTGVALWAGGEAVGQLWLFWVAPIVGALLAGWVHRHLLEGPAD